MRIAGTIAAAIVLGLILAVALVAATGLIRLLKRWRDQAATDREREAYEARDWLDTSDRHAVDADGCGSP